MREDVLGVGGVKFKKIRKNDKKRRFKRWRRPSSENPKKMMRKDVSGGGVEKIRKNDEKRHFRRSKVKVQKIQKKR